MYNTEPGVIDVRYASPSLPGSLLFEQICVQASLVVRLKAAEPSAFRA